MNAPLLAWLAAGLLALACAFQLALAAGAPWGAAAYGGRASSDDGCLPRRYRVASAVAAMVILTAAWVVLAAGSVLDRGPLAAPVLDVVLWCLVAMFALNTLDNARGRHLAERWGAGSVTAC